MRVALLFVLLGCKGEPNHAAMCETRGVSCIEYASKDPKYLERQRPTCTPPSLWGTENACPIQDRMGACVEEHKGWRRTTIYYQPVDEKTKVECGAYGTWVPR